MKTGLRELLCEKFCCVLFVKVSHRLKGRIVFRLWLPCVDQDGFGATVAVLQESLT